MINRIPKRFLISSFISVATGVVYYFSDPHPHFYYDYTFRVAEALLHGRLGITDIPPSWLNEFIPAGDQFFSAFPLGSVLTMLPFAAMGAASLISAMPGAFAAALSASVICWLLHLIEERYDLHFTRRMLMVTGMMFGTWLWANLTLAGAWQLALGFGMVGELGAIYFTVYDRRPLLAGAFFAFAFGNRTEIILTAPIFYFLLVRASGSESQSSSGAFLSSDSASQRPRSAVRVTEPRSILQKLLLFSLIPLVLGISTLLYNHARFGSFVDFGYSHIPGVLNEPWYRHGIFSVFYVPGQAYEMLFKPWHTLESFPYLVPDGFSSSILWCSPFLLFMLRSGYRDRGVKYAAWTAMGAISIVLWLHGNSGGWQFGYRYAIDLLPWAFVILLESSPGRIAPLEWAAYAASFAVNIYAVWLFHWTSILRQ